jgi:hypothetical protein
MAPEAFIYEPLQSRHIRVLEFETSPHLSNIISCRCIHVSLDDRSQKYVAVSYTWGSEQKPCQILINGCLLDITKNVYDIFRSKIMVRSSSRLWIDAICINQEDLEEKSLQVRFMGEVFSNAEHVRVWLGPSSHDSSLAVSFMKTLSSILPEIETGDLERVRYYYTKYPEACPEWIALAQLLSRSWFTRTWVIQEVALSTSAEIVCGEDTLGWDTLDRVIINLCKLGYAGLVSTSLAKATVIRYPASGIRVVWNLFDIRRRLKEGIVRPISWLMGVFAWSEATFESDRIYGFLGIATDVADPIFSPDYTKPPETVFNNITRFIITRDADLSILRCAGANEKPGESPIPSWSFSFYLNEIPRALLGVYPVTTFQKPEFSFSVDSNELRLRGFIIDEVCELGLVSSVIGRKILGENVTPSYFDWYGQAKAMFQSTGQDSEVFWRTLLANKLDDVDRTLDVHTPDKAPDQSWEENFSAFESLFGQCSPEDTVDKEIELLLTPEGTKAMNFRNKFTSATVSRRFSLLREGSVGLMPTKARPGDLVAAFLGAPVLFAVRALSTGEEGRQNYQLLGECYVHDRMNGQVMELGLETQDIVLV